MTQQVTKSIIVKGDISHIYSLWANFENFPNFMRYIKSVTITGPGTSHWVMDGPAGMNVDWNAEMTREEKNKRIAWNSKDHKGMITTSGQVTFNSLPHNETEVTIMVNYTVPAGKAGEFLANLFSNPAHRLEQDLKNFKAYAEGLYERLPVTT
ncbi:MAG: SRPBCC family protein [Chloroflexi bacterium]|nr:SRPBCC family protein [Chloroflexota bacterium]MCI0578365.1 SRPBCC family protein [Chloroflexota bacterium]MCI0646232.1 SRPBCC family protein [Chloroflexota bacterium]MCI0732148.1 SRPBCC family protein [Chloroflexota bacterium]